MTKNQIMKLSRKIGEQLMKNGYGIKADKLNLVDEDNGYISSIGKESIIETVMLEIQEFEAKRK